MYIHLSLLIAVLASLLFNCSATAQDKPKIFVGAASKTLGYSPFWVGTKKGFFEQQGLDVQLVLLRGVPMTVQALSAGSLQIGSGGPEPYIAASERGLDYVITGGIINGLTHFIMAGKNYKTYEDLRGATLGSSSLTGGIVTGLKEALRLKGLEYPRLQDSRGRRRLLGQSCRVAIRSNRRHDHRRAAELCGRRFGLQCDRSPDGRRPQLSGERRGRESFMGRKKPRGDDTFYEGRGAVAALAVR